MEKKLFFESKFLQLLTFLNICQINLQVYSTEKRSHSFDQCFKIVD